MDPWSVFSSYRESTYVHFSNPRRWGLDTCPVSWPVSYPYQGFISIPTKMGGIGQLPPHTPVPTALQAWWVVGILFFLFCVLLTPMSSRSTVYCWMGLGVLTKALGRSPFAFQFLEKHWKTLIFWCNANELYITLTPLGYSASQSL